MEKFFERRAFLFRTVLVIAFALIVGLFATKTAYAAEESEVVGDQEVIAAEAAADLGGEAMLTSVEEKEPEKAEVYLQIFLNGDTTKAAKSVYVGTYVAGDKLDKELVEGKLAGEYDLSKYVFNGNYYSDGPWRQYKAGNLDADAWDFEGRTLKGYTNLFVMLHEIKTCVIKVYKNGDTANCVQNIYYPTIGKGQKVDKDVAMKLLGQKVDLSKVAFNGIFYHDGGWNQFKAGNDNSGWLFETRTIDGWTNLHVMLYDLQTVKLYIFRNGNTETYTDDITLPRVGKSLKLDKSVVEEALKARVDLSKYSFNGVYYHDGGWNQFKAGNDNSGWDFETRSVNGWTNLRVMVYEKCNVRYFLSDADRTAAKNCYHYATGLKGTFLQNTAPDPVKEGYTFKFWYVEGTNVDYFNALGRKVNGWTNLVAKFVPNKYEITFESEGETVATAAVTFDAAVGELPEAPAREGYEFAGWQIEDSEELLSADMVYTTAGNMTVTALWNEIPKTGYEKRLVAGKRKLVRYYDESGKLIKSSFVLTPSGSILYADSLGFIKVGEVFKVDGDLYYAHLDGRIAINEKIVTLFGQRFYAANDGVLSAR